MMKIGYDTVATVLETWEETRQSHENIENEFGLLTLKRLFTIHPKAKDVFVGSNGIDIGRAELHAKAFWRLFDSVFVLLGPDVEFMEEILVQVGQRHRAMGVQPSIFPFMGEAIIYSIEKILKQPLTPKQRDAWDEVYECISNEIVKNMLID